MNEFVRFREAIKMRESGGNYRAENKYGFLGAYQFGRARLLDLGVSIDRFGEKTHSEAYKKALKLSKKEFLENKELQDELFKKHIEDIIKKIKFRYKHLLNKKFRGIKLTLSGLVAGVHLVGFGGLSKWLSGHDVKDGNGVKIDEYIKQFSDYNLEE